MKTHNDSSQSATSFKCAGVRIGPEPGAVYTVHDLRHVLDLDEFCDRHLATIKRDTTCGRTILSGAIGSDPMPQKIAHYNPKGCVHIHHGSWSTLIRVNKAGGGRGYKRITLGHIDQVTREEAEKLNERWVARLSRDDAPAVMTFQYFVEIYFVDQLDRMSVRLREDYQWRLSIMLPTLGCIYMHDFTVRRIQRFLDSQSRTVSGGPYGRETVKHFRNTLSKIFRYAVGMHVVAENPVEGVVLPPADEEPKKAVYKFIPEPEQMKPFLRALPLGASTTPDRFIAPVREMIALAATSGGMSKSECQRVRWSHLNLTDEPTTFFGRNLPAGSIVIPKGKNALRERVMGLPPATVKLLCGWKAASPFNKPNDLVFCSEVGNPLDGKAVWRYLKAAGERTGMPDVASHCFRRFWATQGDRNNMPQADREAGAGWGNSKMAARYTQENVERRREYNSKIAAAIGLDEII